MGMIFRLPHLEAKIGIQGPDLLSHLKQPKKGTKKCETMGFRYSARKAIKGSNPRQKGNKRGEP